MFSIYSTGVFNTQPTQLISLAFRHFVGLIHTLQSIIDSYIKKSLY